ncbi:Glutamyl-Q tRNA(Asp) synthetase [Tepidimonas thermarum]|uniref:Glutamyl-Q tRNA(Asp) synthetase n=1 Tax=Tepidimonas thermarum TaxID=335431 RepID=A0A554WXB7_9BURK|nr:tRNA glutamyl-Q(34) synthetase GluQRS [Tepidimonas thermarum]TSE28219.1 Glutamyl-Q tRNA(Asp) synthetase [Tepidimonas thermarum]
MSATPAGYRGRFAPSPTGRLHAGSLVAALASWLDARAHGGAWLVRIEDVDRPRCVPGADHAILAQLAACGLSADEPPWWQSQREAAYAAALQRLVEAGWAYPCACTRQDIEAAWAARGVPRERHRGRPYPGTCRPEHGGLRGRAPRAWRLHAGRVIRALGLPVPLVWHDRRLGTQAQDVEAAVGDFVLRRADGLWAYQLAVVVDDAAQGITDVVRGEDLADNTPRQIVLQRALGLPTPRYLHTPLVCGDHGEKLSKQNGAQPLELRDAHAALDALAAAAAVLGLPGPAATRDASLHGWIAAWRQRWAAR